MAGLDGVTKLQCNLHLYGLKIRAKTTIMGARFIDVQKRAGAIFLRLLVGTLTHSQHAAPIK